MRRQVQQSDSLEMLLDTMCNTFGGIILLALLIALLARDTPRDETQSRTNPAAGTVAERIEQARRDLAQAIARQAELERRVGDPEQARLLALIEHREQARATVAAQAETIQTLETAASGTATNQSTVKNLLRRMEAAVMETERRLQAERQQAADLAARREELRRSVATESNRLAQAAARNVQRLRLPREHATSKQHLYVIARYGRLYPLYRYQNGQPERNTTTLRWQQESPISKRVDPVPGQGIDPEGQSAAWQQFLQEFPHDAVFLVFQVYEDTFGAFTTAKAATVAAGVEYTWEPQRTNEVLRLGAGPRVGQVQ